jgi:hypothetical protein
MRQQVLRSCVIGFIVLALAAPASAGMPLTRVTFDELPPQAADGLNVNGVTFSSPDAFYGAAGAGTITWIQDPSLEGGATATLTLMFDRPTTLLEFGIARSCTCTLPAGASVDLFAPGAAVRSSTITVATTPLVTFSEGLFSYSGAAIQRAVITFPSPEVATRFSLDNLTFRGAS